MGGVWTYPELTRRRGRGAAFARHAGQRGITLLELLVAMLIMALIATMLYSVLNVGINFSRKGEARARQSSRDRALLGLLHRQIQGVWYDRIQKKVLITSTGAELKLVTTAPLFYRDAGMVMAMYLYEPKSDTLYYTEKKDYYNSSYYQDSFKLDPKEMEVLLKGVGWLRLDYLKEKGWVNVAYRSKVYDLPVRCWTSEGG